MANKIFFYILIRSRNAFNNFDKCINSVLQQNYTDYKILFVDDASNYSKKTRKYIKKKLKGHISVFNKSRKYSLYNAYYLIHKYATNPNAIIFNLDGDDWLLPSALETVAKVYQINPGCQFTYGECQIWDGNKVSKKTSRYILPNTNLPYSQAITKKVAYRSEPFLPLHPRTWSVSLFKSIAKIELLDSRGHWFRFAEDLAILFPMLEMANGNYKVITKPIYVYNMVNIHSDITENTIPLLKDELEIRKKTSPSRKYMPSYRKINIYYNKALSLPIIGNLLYSAQIKFLENDLTTRFFFSGKENVLRDKLLKSVAKSKTVVVKTPKLTVLLKSNTNYKILDYPKIDLPKIGKSLLYDFMWTLVYCNAVTKKTRLSLSRMLPANYPSQ